MAKILRTRAPFSTTKTYPAKLRSVHKRPVINRKSPVCLLRLEFEIYSSLENATDGVLYNTGMLASQDVIVGPGIRMAGDDRVASFANALGLKGGWDNPQSWLKLVKKPTWVTIQFAKKEPPEWRNPFKRITAFSPDEYEIDDDWKPIGDWGSVKDAAEAFDMSVSTMRRRIDALKEDYGEELVRYTSGRHRRINLRLLSKLLY